MSKRILYIDDEVNDLDARIELIRMDGYTCDAMNDNDSALELLRNCQPYDLIIQDVMRPLGKCLENESNPYEAGLVFYEKYIRYLHPQTPVLFVTANLRRDLATKIYNYNLNILHKPVWHEELMSVIKNMVAESKEDLYKFNETISESSNIIKVDFSYVNAEFLSYLASHPRAVYDLSPRRFEELISAILRDLGYETTITPPTRDGGADIYAIRKDAVGEILYVVECKRYAPNRPVGIGQIRGLHGVKNISNASAAILVTTSFFTAPAHALQRSLRYEMSLKDYYNIKEWLTKYSK